jgi:hypothetical protein
LKAALEAWGSEANLFHQGFAKEADDPAIMAATMTKPGVVMRRAVGSTSRTTVPARRRSHPQESKIARWRTPQAGGRSGSGTQAPQPGHRESGGCVRRGQTNPRHQNRRDCRRAQVVCLAGNRRTMLKLPRSDRQREIRAHRLAMRRNRSTMAATTEPRNGHYRFTSDLSSRFVP